ncbi:cob(I)yrinic acid a,c-diamide adenosyltransferase [Enterobacter hormaechei]
MFTGNGKGKTTAALVRHPRSRTWAEVGVIRFIKGEWPNGERNLLEPHGVEFQVMATGLPGIPRTGKPIPQPASPSGSMPKECFRPVAEHGVAG